MSKNASTKEGTLFAVPLRTGGYALGVLARTGGQGVAFGYFFGPKLLDLKVIPREKLRADDALLSGRFGELGLTNGEWPVLGSLQEWSRTAWPMPLFLCPGHKQGYVKLVQYGDDTLEPIRIDEVPMLGLDMTRFLPDEMMGYGFVEIRLTRLLTHGSSS